MMRDVDAAIVLAQRELHLTVVPDALGDDTKLTSGSWRSVVEVLDVAVLAADLPNGRSWARMVTELVHTLKAWYFLVSQPHHQGVDLPQLRTLTRQLRDCFVAAEQQVPGLKLSCPKVHRTMHIPSSIVRYGPYDCLTAEMGEAAHKQFKKMFRRCAIVLP